MRCLMCEEPEIMYIPSDDIPDVGLYSCGVCGFELEGPLERPSRPLAVPGPRPSNASEASVRVICDSRAGSIGPAPCARALEASSERARAAALVRIMRTTPR